MQRSEFSDRPLVVKVGGSLFDLPDLGPRLRHWLKTLRVPEVVLVPGGGLTVDLVRELDRRHGLGEEQSHWLALRALAFNAHLLPQLLPESAVVEDLDGCRLLWQRRAYPILDALRFALADERRYGSLPHLWTVTSDSVAARFAFVIGAGHLILLKSVTIPEEIDWKEASRRGFVDSHFARLVAEAGLAVKAVNLREWRP